MPFDPLKRKANLGKHAIDLADCEVVFDEPMLTREDGPRLISCREAEPYEKQAYFRAYPQH